MVTLVRRLFGMRAYDNRSYAINSCHIAKVLRRVSTPTAAASLNQRPTKRQRPRGGRTAVRQGRRL
jgi:hypothetical protein